MSNVFLSYDIVFEIPERVAKYCEAAFSSESIDQIFNLIEDTDPDDDASVIDHIVSAIKSVIDLDLSGIDDGIEELSYGCWPFYVAVEGVPGYPKYLHISSDEDGPDPAIAILRGLMRRFGLPPVNFLLERTGGFGSAAVQVTADGVTFDENIRTVELWDAYDTADVFNRTYEPFRFSSPDSASDMSRTFTILIPNSKLLSYVFPPQDRPCTINDMLLEKARSILFSRGLLPSAKPEETLVYLDGQFVAIQFTNYRYDVSDVAGDVNEHD